MRVQEAIYQRRSVRMFMKEPVSDAELLLLCQAGLCAPSARNGRPWEFVIVRNENTLRLLRGIRAPWKALETAPAAILVAAHSCKYLQQDCAAAVENILLFAEERGLGTCWLGLYPNMEAVAAVGLLVGLPPDVQAAAVIAVGHALQTHPVSTKTLKEAKIYFERFGGAQ